MITRLTVQSKPEIIEALTHSLSYTDSDNNTITIASDVDINARLLTRYTFYDYLYTDETANATILQSIIDEWRDRTIQLYKTTLYEYNPIWNVDGSETIQTVTDFGHTMTNTDTLKITHTDTRHVTTEQLENGENKTDYGRTDAFTQQTNDTLNRYDNGYDNATAAASYNETSAAGNTLTTAGGTDTVTIDAGKIKSTNGGTLIETHENGYKNEDTGQNVVTETHLRGGNIGVTSTQQLIEAERRIAFDTIEFYISKFAEAFNINPFIAYNSYVEEE